MSKLERWDHYYNSAAMQRRRWREEAYAMGVTVVVGSTAELLGVGFPAAVAIALVVLVICQSAFAIKYVYTKDRL